jgi:hypothetical protein
MKKNNKTTDSDLISSSDSETYESEISSFDDKKNPEFRIENPVKFFNQKELCHYKNINKYFKECYEKNPEFITKMINIIEGKSDISLRILDWFVTKYSKKKIVCNGNVKNVEAFDVKISYKAQLKTYKKRYFDPFRRKKKFYYPCEKEGFIKIGDEIKHIYTTLGQLNFFRWAFTNGIVSYVEDNLSFIVSEMNIFNKDEKRKKIQNQAVENAPKKVVKPTANNISSKEKEDKLRVNAVKTKENDEIKFVLTFD